MGQEKELARQLRAAVEDSGLEEKQKLFCQYYVESHNATQAYVKAYGCTVAAAGVSGHRLLKNANIQQEIKHLRESLEAHFDIDKYDMIRFCLKVVGADLGDYCEFRPQEIDVIDRDGNTTKGTISSVIVKDSDYCDTSLIKSIRQQGAAVHIELYSKQWAWEKLDKFFSWTAEKQAEEGSGTISIAEVIAKAKKRAERMEAEADGRVVVIHDDIRE